MIIKLLLLFLLPIVAQANYIIKDLGLRELGNSTPLFINDRNEVIGTIEVSAQNEYFYWSPESGKSILYQIPKGAKIVKMNNLGHVVGSYLCWEGLWSPKQVMHPFLWSQESGFCDLESIDGNDTYALAINDCAQIALMTKGGQLYLWQNGEIKKLEGAVAENEESVVLNSHELIFAKKGNNGSYTIVKRNLKSDQMITFAFPYDQPLLKDVNEWGCIIGTCVKAQEYGLIINPKGAFTLIPNFETRAINNNNLIAGSLLSPLKCGAYLREGTKVFDINTLLVPKEKQNHVFDSVFSCNGINNKGVIAATVRSGSGRHAVLIHPINIQLTQGP